MKQTVWLLLLPLAACGTRQAVTTVPATAAAQDRRFAEMAANNDAFEVQSSRVALEKSRRPAIRSYAQRMINEHSVTTQRLSALASQKGLTLPTTPDTDAQAKLSALHGANGAAFDRLYVRDQVDGHQDAQAVLQSEITDGADAQLKAFAQETLPHVQEHLAMAQKLR